MERFFLICFSSFLFCSFTILIPTQKPIVVIIPSYNNAQWCGKNIESVLTQNYSNYRVIYIDDCSSDATYNLVVHKVQELQATDRVEIMRNPLRRGALANIYTAVHTCRDDEIVVLVDGDDWLAHENVLERVNVAYQDPAILMTYGQFKVYPDNRIGECKDIPKPIAQGNYYREYHWCTSHLRTFYASLFKQIKLQDLIYKGNFFEVTWDMAIMFPMLEMSGGRFTCIQDVLYIYNCATDANDFKTKLLLQIYCNKLISSKQKYAPLDLSVLFKQEPSTVSLIMLSCDNPHALQQFLTSLDQYGSGLHETRVLYCASNQQIKTEYEYLQTLFAHIRFEQSEPQSFKTTMLKQLHASGTYTILACDGVLLDNAVHFDYCAQVLRKTHALGFYYNLGKNKTSHRFLERSQEQPSFVSVDPDICAWQFADGEYEWRIPFTCSMAMYKTSMIAAQCQSLRYDSWQSLEQAFLLARFDVQAVGLMHEYSKVVTL